jgi:DNA-binding IclR family transcriptional regulator
LEQRKSIPLSFSSLSKAYPWFLTLCNSSLNKLREELQRVRNQGYAFDNEENERGIKCIGAPIFDFSQRVVAAVSISGYYLSVEENKDTYLSELLKTCEKISNALRGKK